MLLKCQTSPLKRIPPTSTSQSGLATAVSLSSGSISSTQYVSGPPGTAARQPIGAGSGKGKGKGGKNLRNGAGGCGGPIPSVVIPSTAGTAKSSSSPSRLQRKLLRIPTKRIPGRIQSGKLASVTGRLTATRQRQHQQQQLQQFSLQHQQQQQQHQQRVPTSTSCDNSNDSGLGFDRGIDTNPLTAGHLRGHHPVTASTSLTPGVDRPLHQSRVMSSSLAHPTSSRLPGKRPPLLQSALTGAGSASATYTSGSSDGMTAVQSQFPSSTRDGRIHLQILTQPEQQHRARYQTEGSRGAVKDRTGNGFPVVRLVGYNKPTVLQVFIGTDMGRVQPHMFYQACKVSGKNSTPCIERKLDGTMVIEVDMKPENEMTVTCDCVGILKERNVDVEHRFPEQSGARAKKKSTRCRMVFRTTVTNEDGAIEMLQVCSQQIVCTQPPGVPEICKKSLVSCPAEGGLELYILGKNFLKDTKVVFHRRRTSPVASTSTKPSVDVLPWEQAVTPDKEYLQQTHLICMVPPYINPDILEPVTVQIFIVSAGKRSETHNFTYTPKGHHTALTAATTLATSGVGSSFFGSLPSGAGADNTVEDVFSSPNMGGGGLLGGSSGGSSSCTLTTALLEASATAASGGRSSSGADTSFNPLSFGSQQSEESISTLHDIPAARKSLLFWEAQQMAQAVQEKLDTGMMPPPVHVLQFPATSPSVATGRRSSLAGEQQVALPSPPGFKAELIDESSLGPGDEDSREQFPESTDNSVDNSQILYRRRSVRQPSMDLMEDSSSMSLLVNENSAMDVGAVPGTIVGFRSGLSTLMETNEMSNSSTSPASELKVMDLCIKQEASNLPSARNQIEHMITTPSAPIDTLDQVDKIKSQFKVDDMMSSAVQQTGTQVIESTLANIVKSQQASAAMMDLGSVMPLPSSSTSVHSPVAAATPMLTSDMTGSSIPANQSPLSQDVMLNAQPPLAVNSPTNLVLATSPASADVSPHPHATMSPDLILNPSVSPSSMICSPSNATVAATAAAAVAAAAAVSEGKNMLTNQVLNNMAAVAANMIESQPKETTQAVQDIILNAAAEILTSQEPSVTTQTTINALITMNAQEMMTTSCQAPTHTMNSQHNMLPQCQPTPMVSDSMESALQQQQQQQLVQNLITESIQQQTQLQQQQATESLLANLAVAQHQQIQQQQQQLQQQQQQLQQQQQHHQLQQHQHQQQQLQQLQEQRPPIPEQMDIGNAIIPLTVQPPQQPMDTTGSILPANPMMQQQESPAKISTAIAQQQQQQQQVLQLSPQQQQQQQSQPQHQQQQQQQQQHQQQQQQATGTAGANIPQELTTMSDNDLISYINPNAFDGV